MLNRGMRSPSEHLGDLLLTLACLNCDADECLGYGLVGSEGHDVGRHVDAQLLAELLYVLVLWVVCGRTWRAWRGRGLGDGARCLRVGLRYLCRRGRRSLDRRNRRLNLFRRQRALSLLFGCLFLYKLLCIHTWCWLARLSLWLTGGLGTLRRLLLLRLLHKLL